MSTKEVETFMPVTIITSMSTITAAKLVATVATPTIRRDRSADSYDCSHYHNLCGITTFDFGHTCAYNAMTGPAIELPDGMHTRGTI